MAALAAFSGAMLALAINDGDSLAISFDSFAVAFDVFMAGFMGTRR